jgi:hydrogenase/urease accessory protein HupE
LDLLVVVAVGVSVAGYEEVVCGWDVDACFVGERVGVILG